MLNLRAVGNAAKTSTDVRAPRCFVVPADDNHVKWIWAAESQPELRELGRVFRASGVLTQFGVATEEDTVPTSKQAKLVSNLLSERRVIILVSVVVCNNGVDRRILLVLI